MEILSWKQEALTVRRYAISGASGPVGRLEFNGWTSNDAAFTSERIQLLFERKGWLDQQVTISFNGEVIGMSKTSGFGKTVTTLVTGERFTLEGKALSSSRALVDAAGHTVMRFDHGNLSGATGSIVIDREVPELTKLLLVAIGLYFKNLGQ